MFGLPYLNFTQDWANYKAGFGDHTREFWWGNDNIHRWAGNQQQKRAEFELCGSGLQLQRSTYIYQLHYIIFLGTSMCSNVQHLHIGES